MKKKAPKGKPVPTCAYCYKQVHPGFDGGSVRIPTSISGKPSADVMLHNACLNSYIDEAETRRQTITPITVFEKASSDKPARRIG